MIFNIPKEEIHLQSLPSKFRTRKDVVIFLKSHFSNFKYPVLWSVFKVSAKSRLFDPVRVNEIRIFIIQTCAWSISNPDCGGTSKLLTVETLTTPQSQSMRISKEYHQKLEGTHCRGGAMRAMRTQWRDWDVRKKAQKELIPNLSLLYPSGDSPLLKTHWRT